MVVAEYIDVLRGQGAALAEAAGRAGLGATVPTCSPWLVKDLLRHTGYVHRWAARHITERPASVLDGPEEAEILRGGGSDEDLIEWFGAGHAALVQTLATADPDVSCGTFMAAPSPLAFWARRQAHETAIHRADAEIASGSRPGYPAAFAADGIDELIMGFGRRRKYAPRALPADRPGEAGCTVTGPASAVYLFLWNRSGPVPADVTIGGDRDALTSWQASVRVRWD